ncbi:MAG TPA: carbamate kinase [Clostridiales bacterium UBA8960]|nr:carbamate kinase [Clostridiales bacterium UBA8960]
MLKTAVIAIGGNAIISEGQKGTIEEQFENVLKTCDPIIDLLEEGYNVVLTHGNGPHVGNALIKNDAAKNSVPPYPMDACGAETQGLLGYVIKQAMENRIVERGLSKEIAAVVTQVKVDENDPGFKNPTKPVGPFYSKEEAAQLESEKGFVMIEDSGRGYRRVVASPKPLDILEKNMIKTLVKENFLVIAVGGGGIPVIEQNKKISGVEAVIDKDYASALLAEEIDADLLIILTGVEKVAVNFGKPNQAFLSEMTLADAEKHMSDGQFPPGSMGPKIDAAMNFVRNGQGEAIITSISKLKEAVKGGTGTRIIK